MLKFILYALAFGVAVSIALNASDLANAHCSNKWKDSGLSTRYAWGTGCMVEVDGHWVPEANVQISLKFKLGR